MFPRRHIECINTPDGRVLRSSREIREAFRVHFRNRFARCPEIQVQEFRNYLADFPALERRKRLVARVWLRSARSVVR